MTVSRYPDVYINKKNEKSNNLSCIIKHDQITNVLQSNIHHEDMVGKYVVLKSVYKKRLKIPQAKTVYRRRTDNTMVKRKRTNGQTTIYKTYI
jgi:hypothetical protein